MTKRSFEELILSGGDDRLDLLDNGMNKYNVNPCQYETTFSRASCTCSPFSPDGYAAAYELYQRLDENSFDQVREHQTDRVKSLLNYDNKDRFDVFYAPSGSDLCYYCLLFSKLIHPDRDINNVITCPEELGSGSIAAHHGKFFGKRNQFGEEVPKGMPLDESLVVESAQFSARSAEGAIINHCDAIVDEIHGRYLSHSICANLVIGSKSGIENNTSIVSRAPEDVLWTVDLCQFRASRVLLNGLLGMNCCTMLTGSKFYQSPPFCAMMLVPKTITDRFDDKAAPVAASFKQIFSAYDIPKEFSKIRQQLSPFMNFGLMLRWEAALVEMEKLAKIDSYLINETIRKWNKFVVDRIGANSCFEIMPGQEQTNKTIISFRVRTDDGKFLTHEELTTLYRSICQKPVAQIDGFDRVLFGQPVKYGDKSFIRIALGNHELCRFINGEDNFDNDGKLIDIIVNCVSEFR